jgi:sugar phosphate isomerase/epimerase
MAKKKSSIGAWAYIWGGYEEDPIPLEKVVKQLQDYGFDGIEFAAFEPHVRNNTPQDWKDIKKLFDDHGLEISGVAAPFPSPATTDKKAYLDVVKNHIEMCKTMGIPKLRTESVDPPTEIPGGMDYETCFHKVADVWHDSAELCDKADIMFVWEFEPGFLFNKPSEVVRMAHLADHDNFKVMFDSCHAYMCGVLASRQMGEKEVLPGGVVQFAHMLTGKIGHIHLIDSDGTLHDDETSTHAPLGTGKLDFDAIMPAILEAGYDDEWWAIDLCFWPNALDVTEDNKKYLDKLIDKYGK